MGSEGGASGAEMAGSQHALYFLPMAMIVSFSTPCLCFTSRFHGCAWWSFLTVSLAKAGPPQQHSEDFEFFIWCAASLTNLAATQCCWKRFLSPSLPCSLLCLLKYSPLGKDTSPWCFAGKWFCSGVTSDSPAPRSCCVWTAGPNFSWEATAVIHKGANGECVSLTRSTCSVEEMHRVGDSRATANEAPSGPNLSALLWGTGRIGV